LSKISIMLHMLLLKLPWLFSLLPCTGIIARGDQWTSHCHSLKTSKSNALLTMMSCFRLLFQIIAVAHAPQGEILFKIAGLSISRDRLFYAAMAAWPLPVDAPLAAWSCFCCSMNAGRHFVRYFPAMARASSYSSHMSWTASNAISRTGGRIMTR
jgi:hypothetical protein